MKRGDVSFLVRRGVAGGLVVGLLLVSAGCAGKGNVKGKLTYQNKPVKGGEIVFFNQEDGHAYSGAIDQDGNYTISKLPPGPVKITIQPAAAPKMTGGFMRGAPEGAMKGPPQGMMPEGVKNPYEGATEGDFTKLPEKYKNEKMTDLEYIVIAGDQEHNIDLKDVK
jgi:hypothetical protein